MSIEHHLVLYREYYTMEKKSTIPVILIVVERSAEIQQTITSLISSSFMLFLLSFIYLVSLSCSFFSQLKSKQCCIFIIIALYHYITVLQFTGKFCTFTFSLWQHTCIYKIEER